MSVEVKTEHPHIVQIEGVCGGRPSNKGSSIPVWQIALMFKTGDTPEDILEAYPHLSAAQIYDAISYNEALSIYLSEFDINFNKTLDKRP